MARSNFYAGLNEQETVDLKQSILSSTVFRKRLLKSLYDDLSSLEKESRSKNNYSKPAWPYMQADIIGAKRCTNKLIDLLKSLDK